MGSKGLQGDLRGSPSDLDRGMRHLRGVPGGPGGPRARARFPAECCVSPPYRFYFRSLGDWWRGGDLRGSRGDLRGSPRDFERGMRDLRGGPGGPGGRGFRPSAASAHRIASISAAWAAGGEGHEASTRGPGRSRGAQSEGEVSLQGGDVTRRLSAARHHKKNSDGGMTQGARGASHSKITWWPIPSSPPVAQAAEIEAIRWADAALGRKPRPRSGRPRDPPGPHVDPPCPSRDLLVIPRGLPVSPLDPHLATSRPSCGNRSDTVATMGSKGLPGRPPGITKRSRQGHEASTGGPGRSRGAQSEGEVSGRELRQPAVSLLFPQPGRLVARWGSKGLTGRPPRVTKRSREGHEGSRDAPGGSRASQSEGEVSGRVLRQPA
eukprot:gene17362-biopygen8933